MQGEKNSITMLRSKSLLFWTHDTCTLFNFTSFHESMFGILNLLFQPIRSLLFLSYEKLNLVLYIHLSRQFLIFIKIIMKTTFIYI